MKLHSFLLLETKTYENYIKELIKRNHMWNIYPRGTIKEILQNDPTATETNVGNYADWVMKNYFKDEGNEEVKELLNFFHNNKNLFDRPIEKFRSYAELKKVVEAIKINQLKAKYKNTKMDLTIEGWSVKKINNFDESRIYGVGTKWCTTSGPQVLKRYINKASGILVPKRRLYYIFNGTRKWAVTQEHNLYSVWDPSDRDINIKVWAKKVPTEILKFMGLGPYEIKDSSPY
jgi:hypothetical protein